MNICIDLQGPMAQVLLDDNHDVTRFFKLNYAPLVFINGRLFKGNLDDPGHFLEVFCSSFESPPPDCDALQSHSDFADFTSPSLSSFVLSLVCYLALFVLISVVLYYFVYKRKLKRKMESELADQVNTAMHKYYSAGQMT